MKSPIALSVVAGASWLAGVLGGFILKLAVFHEAPGPDLILVAGWSAGLFAISLVVAYIPALFALSRIASSVSPWVAGLLGLALSFVPLGMLHWAWDGRFHVSLTGYATRIFLPVFAIAGVAFSMASLDRE